MRPVHRRTGVLSHKFHADNSACAVGDIRRMGAYDRTFAGLTGIGDLVVTCTSRHSRNNRFGFKVGSGVPVKDALEQVGTVEGYYAALMAYQLGKKYSIDLPIINKCYEILYEGANVDTAVRDLMIRPMHQEN